VETPSEFRRRNPENIQLVFGKHQKLQTNYLLI
jgi:hypothetical protein